MQVPTEVFELSAEQQDTASLLERLFGRAISNRYIDFSRLAASATGLRVSRPMAAHALRELDSMIRFSLEVPMDAKAATDEEDEEKTDRAIEALKLFDFDEEALQRARKALAPRLNHARQIKLIAQRLGLSPEGDIATAWVSLCSSFGRAHERHHHRDLTVDDEFRNTFQKPFDFVLRGILASLQKRYAALMQRVEAIAAMSDYGEAINIFEKEIPGALPLQWHFYQTINSPDWLPHLLKRSLVREPLAAGGSEVREFGEWPVGHYLLKIAKSGNKSADQYVVESLRSVAPSHHADVRRQGLEIIAALPPATADTLVDIAVGWINLETPNFYHTAAEQILKRFAENSFIDSALKVAAAMFQVRDRSGNLASLHPEHMYEHHLPSAVATLSAKDGRAAVRLFSQLLVQAANITRKTAHEDEEDRDYTYVTPHSLSTNEMAQYGIYEALIIAVRDAALMACQRKPETTDDIVSFLNSCHLKIFRRIALHVLSKNANAASDAANASLSDVALIGEGWCEDEFAELALAFFPCLSADQKQRILATIDALPDRFRARWRENFAANHGALPTAEDERRYNLAVVREATWKWREVLPAERRQLLENSVAELGNPDAWHERLFPSEFSPLTGPDFLSRPMHDILSFLKTWEPSDEPVRHTVAALGQELRSAVEKEAGRFTDAANQFADLRPIYVRRLLEGFDTKARNNERLEWGHVLELIRSVIERLKQPTNIFSPADGDDKDWFWCSSTAAALLKSGLRRGENGVPFEHKSKVEDIIFTLYDLAPHEPRDKDFEETFRRHPYFAAEQSLWGSSIELCVLFVWWSSKQSESPVARSPRSALQLLPRITNALERALSDMSEWGRIPRAIIGRYLNLLGYFGERWLTEHISSIFPEDSDILRRSAWLGHLINDTGPIRSLVSQLSESYIDEISRLNSGENQRDDEIRGNRLGDYLLVLWLWDAAPASIMSYFWERAPAQVRRHVMGFLGRELQLPPDALPEECTARGRAYWETRLNTAISSSVPDDYREELGAISQWFIHDAANIAPLWLLDQLLLMLKSGFAPSHGYSVIEWLGKIASAYPDKAVEVFSEMLNSRHLNHWTYTTHRMPVRAILENGLQAANPETAQRTRDVISLLATIGETGYLDLVRPNLSANE